MLDDIVFYRDLFRLARNRKKSGADYAAFQRHQARRILSRIERILKPSKDALVVDYGCGDGGYAEALASRWQNLIAADFRPPDRPIPGIKFIGIDLMEWVSPEPAGFIFCSSVIEHVKDKCALIAQLKRNLKPGGFLYLSFPPFLSFSGGHQLKPFHYLPESAAIWIGKLAHRIGPEVTGYENLFGTWGLYKVGIAEVKRLLIHHGFRIIACRPRFLKLNTTTIPLLSDFLTWHVEFYCIRG